jgi:CubicO group peptidase (beta-lactamase class C family)
VADITIRHLLTMTAGWAWDGQVNFARTAETDDLDLMLTRPMACDPGDCFEYDSGSSNVLAYVVQALSGELMADYLQPRLFDPLGIAPPEWVVTEDGANRGGGGIHLTAGTWPRSDTSTSTRESGTASASSAGAGSSAPPPAEQRRQPPQRRQHRRGALRLPLVVDEVAGKPAFAALGYGGQILYVVPDLDLVVATTVPSADAASRSSSSATARLSRS